MALDLAELQIIIQTMGMAEAKEGLHALAAAGKEAQTATEGLSVGNKTLVDSSGAVADVQHMQVEAMKTFAAAANTTVNMLKETAATQIAAMKELGATIMSQSIDNALELVEIEKKKQKEIQTSEEQAAKERVAAVNLQLQYFKQIAAEKLAEQSKIEAAELASVKEAFSQQLQALRQFGSTAAKEAAEQAKEVVTIQKNQQADLAVIAKEGNNALLAQIRQIETDEKESAKRQLLENQAAAKEKQAFAAEELDFAKYAVQYQLQFLQQSGKELVLASKAFNKELAETQKERVSDSSIIAKQLNEETISRLKELETEEKEAIKRAVAEEKAAIEERRAVITEAYKNNLQALKEQKRQEQAFLKQSNTEILQEEAAYQKEQVVALQDQSELLMGIYSQGAARKLTQMKEAAEAEKAQNALNARNARQQVEDEETARLQTIKDNLLREQQALEEARLARRRLTGSYAEFGAGSASDETDLTAVAQRANAIGAVQVEASKQVALQKKAIDDEYMLYQKVLAALQEADAKDTDKIILEAHEAANKKRLAQLEALARQEKEVLTREIAEERNMLAEAAKNRALDLAMSLKQEQATKKNALLWQEQLNKLLVEEGVLRAELNKIKATTKGDDSPHLVTAGFLRELIVLSHELVTGQFSRIGPSMMVLAERAGAAFLSLATLINPLFDLAIAAAAVVYAVWETSNEFVRFQAALNHTSNYAGQTKESFHALQQSMVDTGKVTVGESAQIMTALADSGKVSKDVFNSVSLLVVDYKEKMHVSAEEAAQATLKLFVDPAKFAWELAKAHKSVNLGMVSYVQQLQSSGQKTEATKEATKLLKGVLEQTVSPLTALDTLFIKIKSTLSETLPIIADYTSKIILVTAEAAKIYGSWVSTAAEEAKKAAATVKTQFDAIAEWKKSMPSAQQAREMGQQQKALPEKGYIEQVYTPDNFGKGDPAMEAPVPTPSKTENLRPLTQAYNSLMSGISPYVKLAEDARKATEATKELETASREERQVLEEAAQESATEHRTTVALLETKIERWERAIAAQKAAIAMPRTEGDDKAYAAQLKQLDMLTDTLHKTERQLHAERKASAHEATSLATSELQADKEKIDYTAKVRKEIEHNLALGHQQTTAEMLRKQRLEEEERLDSDIAALEAKRAVQLRGFATEDAASTLRQITLLRLKKTLVGPLYDSKEIALAGETDKKIKDINIHLQERFDKENLLAKQQLADMTLSRDEIQLATNQRKADEARLTALASLNVAVNTGRMSTVQYNEELGKLNATTELQKKALLEIFNARKSLEKDWVQGAVKGLKDYNDSVTNVFENSRQLVANSFKGMEDALVSFVRTGKLDFKSLADSILNNLIRMQVQASITAPLSKMLGGLFGARGGILSELIPGVGNPSGGAHAGGGSVSSDMPTMVGESGPELFVPTTSGSIISNNSLKQQGQKQEQVTIIINQPLTLNANSASAETLGMVKQLMPAFIQQNKNVVLGLVKTAFAQQGRRVLA